MSDDATIVAFVTDYKAIMLRLGDIASEGKGDTGYVYVGRVKVSLVATSTPPFVMRYV